MKRFTFALWVAVAACKKPDVVGGAAPATGSGSATPAVGSAAPAAGSAVPAAGSAAAGDAPFDDTLAIPKQPKRSPEQQAIVDKAISALRTGLTAAKTIKDAAALCKTIPPLNKAITASLFDVTAPPGVDATAYASEREATGHPFDGLEGLCQYPENLNVEDVQRLMSELRTHFVLFIGLGA